VARRGERERSVALALIAATAFLVGSAVLAQVIYGVCNENIDDGSARANTCRIIGSAGARAAIVFVPPAVVLATFLVAGSRRTGTTVAAILGAIELAIFAVLVVVGT
jgi:hypothetical protein